VIADGRGIDPATTDLFRRFEPPSAEHWLGTDDLGRDLFQRLLDGGRVSLLVGFRARFLSAIMGALIGVWPAISAAGSTLSDAAHRRRHFAAPAAAADRPGRHRPAQDRRAGRDRAVRDVFALSHRRHRGADRLDDGRPIGAGRDAVAESARLHPRRRALGAQPARIMFRHILPNAAGSLVVATTLSVGTLILLESTLSFLGLGTQPPAASWGNMLTGAQELLQQAPMLACGPAC
jgi:peptide/nickel transport system permease protein